MAVYAAVQQTNHDFSSAEVYGQIEILFPLGISVTNVDVISDAAREWFQDFDFQDDVFLPVGNPLVVAIMSMCLLEEAVMMQVDVIKMLEWDRVSRTYIVREYHVCEEIKEEEENDW